MSTIFNQTLLTTTIGAFTAGVILGRLFFSKGSLSSSSSYTSTLSSNDSTVSPNPPSQLDVTSFVSVSDTSLTSPSNSLSPSPTTTTMTKTKEKDKSHSLAGPLHDHCRRAVAGERAGRTRAERALRDYLNGGSGIGASNSALADTISGRIEDLNDKEEEDDVSNPSKSETNQKRKQPSASSGSTNSSPSVLPSSPITPAEGYNCLPIGYIEAPFVARNGTPRQGMLAPDARANLVFLPAIPGVMLEGLENFSHVFIIFVFHENTNLHKVRAAELGLNKNTHRQFRKSDLSSNDREDKQGRKNASENTDDNKNEDEDDDNVGEKEDQDGNAVNNGGRPYNPWRRNAASSSSSSSTTTSSGRHGPRVLRGSGRSTSNTAKDASTAALALAGPGGAAALDDALRARIYQARVEAPALKGGRVGVFGSRSPHRPNAIGLTMCKLEGVHAGGGKFARDGRRMLVLSGCDLVNGTPVLDVKPYIPLDCPRCLGNLLLGNKESLDGKGPSTNDEEKKREQEEEEKEEKKKTYGKEMVSNGKQNGQHFNQDNDSSSKRYSFKPSRTLEQAEASLAFCADFHPKAFTRIVPEWVLYPLIAERSNRLPVVWGPGTMEAVISAVETNNCHFYGPDAKRLCAISADNKGERDESTQGTVDENSQFAVKELNMMPSSSSSSSSSVKSSLPFFDKEDEALLMIRAITQILALDIRSVRNGRGGEPVYQPIPLQERNYNNDSSDCIGSTIEGLGQERDEDKNTTTASQIDSTVGQWMELYFDVLYIRFTVRDKRRANSTSNSSSNMSTNENGGSSYVQVEDVTFAKERKR